MPRRFFCNGRVENVMTYLAQLGVSFAKRKALDFGCGVGRVTQPLARYFDQVWGIDIAPSMIELARIYNQYGERCQYLVNEAPDLRLVGDHQFDFVYSNITLQHMEPDYAKSYIREFVRVLAPGGVVLFQIPSHLVRRTLRRMIRDVLPAELVDLYRALRHRGRPRMGMYGVKKDEMLTLLQHAGASILDVQPDHSAGPEWSSFRYLAVKH